MAIRRTTPTPNPTSRPAAAAAARPPAAARPAVPALVLPTPTEAPVVAAPAPAQKSGGGDYRVLVLGGFGVRLYEAIGGQVREVRDATFPLTAPSNPPRRADSAPVRPAMTFEGRHLALLAAAAVETAQRARLRPTPVLVVGSRLGLRRFALGAGNLDYSSVRRRPPVSLGRVTRLAQSCLAAPGAAAQGAAAQGAAAQGGSSTRLAAPRRARPGTAAASRLPRLPTVTVRPGARV